MLNQENLEKFIKAYQTDKQNVVREYCQHVFLSFLYQQSCSERLLFKGGTALRIIFKSPRFSEDLDFTGTRITHAEIEGVFADTLADVERVGINVDIDESTPTTGGYIGIAVFHAYDMDISIQIEVSLRYGKNIKGQRTVIKNDYLPTYTLVQMPADAIIEGKLQALMARHKPRDFYDYFFLLSSDYLEVRKKETLAAVLVLLKNSQINFRTELKQFLPASHAMHLRDFRKILTQKIESYL